MVYRAEELQQSHQGAQSHQPLPRQDRFLNVRRLKRDRCDARGRSLVLHGQLLGDFEQYGRQGQPDHEHTWTTDELHFVYASVLPVLDYCDVERLHQFDPGQRHCIPRHPPGNSHVLTHAPRREPEDLRVWHASRARLQED